ncbi:hypothetical protein ILUMI_01609 [Ignelater luminosus]|uniref:Codanin-1 C-terminal domain-containing protein n=1 Tax=Ignelater luminosus TaxID=2038154 RepID=A0A8K0DJB6_IGNLU|nr:hypothetical protein ILUMI_01609 [Ignelater luminosus]
MCEQVLSDTLDGKIQINLLLNWLVNETLEDATFNELRNNKCLQSDFVSYFLNFIHDIQAFTNKSVEIPQKVSTPKRIERFIITHDENNCETPSVKRRSALFENGTPHSQMDVCSFIHSRDYEENDNVSPNNSFYLGVSPLLDDINFNCDSKNETKFSNNMLFGTIHNRVYFASKVLQSQISILSMLDKSTLRLLIENKRLKNFTSSSFISRLLQIHEDKPDKTSEILEHIQSNVCFISDTDNRDNFPNDPSFHAFRKQRDLFYEIIRIWENNHLQDEWNYVVALGGKIKALLNMHSDVINLVHFARLFKAQLLMNTCGKHEDTFQENAVSESQLSFLSSIPNVDTEKLLRLKSRIVSKQSENSINSTPIFSGYQEFYRDFILVAANHIFNRHLNDALISEIIDLNNTKFSSDFDDNGGSVDSSTQNAYTLCIKSLRILAKFLGFLESLPYKSDNIQLSQNVVSCQIRIRNEIQPGLNLKAIINNSISNKSLIVTIPWIIKYFSMLDHITLRLSYFEEILNMLFEIYYFHLNKLTSNSKHNYKQKNIFLVKLCLGWLFELPHFPEDSYYKFLSQKLLLSKLTKVQINNSSETIFLDELDLVDQNALYICCPYLQDIKKILSDSINTLNNPNVTIKHITPLTAVESPTDLSNRRIQLQLEEAFFNGQPVSIRKTVEFISERVASSCVKQVCNEIVPNFKKKVLADLKSLFSLFNVPDDINSDHEEFSKIKAMITTETSRLANSSLNALREHIDKELKSFSNARIASAVDSLLAMDVLTQTKDVCVSIATRLCRERVQQWINSHVNLGIFSKDFDTEVRHFLASNSSKQSKHKPIFALPIYGKDLKHNPDALSGADLVEHVRNYCWTVLEKPGNLTVDMIMELLKLIRQSINERCDLNDCILILINRMLVDFLILIIGNRGDIVQESDVMMSFCSIWKQKNCQIDDLFKTLICFRNIHVISHSLNVSISWKSFEKFLKILLEEKLLTCDLLEAQIVAIDKDKLDEVTLKDLDACVQAVMNVDLKTGESSSR